MEENSEDLKHIEKRVEALQEQRDQIDEEYSKGNLSEKDYKEALAKNDYLMAEIKERAIQEQDRSKDKGRDVDMFGD